MVGTGQNLRVIGYLLVNYDESSEFIVHWMVPDGWIGRPPAGSQLVSSAHSYTVLFTGFESAAIGLIVARYADKCVSKVTYTVQIMGRQICEI